MKTNRSYNKTLKMSRSAKGSVFLIFFLLAVVKTAVGETEGKVPKCCPPGAYLAESQRVCSDNKSMISLNCENGAMLLDPRDNEFKVEPDGILSFSDGAEKSEEFCLSQFGPDEKVVALVCFESSPQSDFVVIILKVLMLISTIFLLITLYIYLVLPNLKDLQGKCVIAFISCLIASYITLLVVQTFPNSSQTACIIQAAVLYYFMSATFFWNNIITFTIWKGIRNAAHKMTEKSQVILYIAWGFGVPLLMVAVAFLLEHVPGGNHIRPQFGVVRCWFSGSKETWSYFYGPVSILLILNTVMFLQSIWTLWKNYRTLTDSKLRSLRFKCFMYLKLFLLMGITWIFEVISHALSSHKHSRYIWFITDCLNGAQGVTIFLILVVFRQKVRFGLVKNKFLKINWPESWVREEKIEESYAMSVTEEFELRNQKLKMIDESQKN